MSVGIFFLSKFTLFGMMPAVLPGMAVERADQFLYKYFFHQQKIWRIHFILKYIHTDQTSALSLILVVSYWTQALQIIGHSRYLETERIILAKRQLGTNGEIKTGMREASFAYCASKLSQAFFSCTESVITLHPLPHSYAAAMMVHNRCHHRNFSWSTDQALFALWNPYLTSHVR